MTFTFLSEWLHLPCDHPLRPCLRRGTSPKSDMKTLYENHNYTCRIWGRLGGGCLCNEFRLALRGVFLYPQTQQAGTNLSG